MPAPDDTAPAAPRDTAPAPPRPSPARVGLGAVAVLAGAALLGGAAALGAAPSAAVAAVLAIALAVGWPGLLALPSPRGTTTVVAASGVAAALAAAADAAGAAGSGEPLRRLPVVLALTVLVASAHQLLRRDLRPRVVDSLGGTLLGAGLAGGGAGWAALPGVPAGASLAVVAACAGAAACLLVLLPLPAAGAAATSAVGAVVVGGAVAAVAPDLGAGTGAVLGLVVAVLVLGLHHLLARLPAAGRLRSRVVLAAAPLTASGTAALLVGAVLVG